uniref:Oxysterol-binding protein n=1 Tax=Strigamia maritima TaxID=126957 RepID=T1JEI6_STRMM
MKMVGNFLLSILLFGVIYNVVEGKSFGNTNQDMRHDKEVRKAKDNQLFYWPDGIVPYVLDKSVSYSKKTIITGMNLWSMSTCLKFQEVNSTFNSPHLIFKRTNGCHSAIGRSSWQKGQVVSIGSGCDTRFTVAHEVGHAIGLYHEQSRPDRDDYVVVLDKNINVAEKYNFDIETDINSYGVPYDLTSLMHYDIDTFSANGKNTIVPKDIFKTFDVGQRQRLSYYDVKLVNLMYNCNVAKCAHIADSCKNGGYRSKTCRCSCPPRFFGDLCEETSEFTFSQPCKLNVTNPSEITTPKYPNNYPSDSKCIWLITAPHGKKVRLNFSHFDLEERQIKSGRCEWDYVEIREQDLYNGNKYCSKELLNSKITSSNNVAAVLFKSEFGSHTGFKLQIEFFLFWWYTALVYNMFGIHDDLTAKFKPCARQFKVHFFPIFLEGEGTLYRQTTYRKMETVFMLLIIQTCGAIKVYDLSHPINQQMPKYSNLPNMYNHSDFINSTHWLHQFYGLNTVNERNLDQVFYSLETVGTHLAAPVKHNKANWQLHEIAADRLVAPLVVVKTNEEQGVQIQHLKYWERKNGPIPKGSVVVMDSGWSTRWNTDVEYYLGINVHSQKPQFPGFDKTACEYLISRHVVGVGVDTMAVDGSEYFADQPCLSSFANDDIYTLHNLKNLRSVPECGTLIFVGVVNMFNLAGSPSRVMAVQFEDNIIDCSCADANSWTLFVFFLFSLTRRFVLVLLLTNMPLENLEEEGLAKNPNLELAQWKFLLTLDTHKNDLTLKNKLLDAIKRDGMAPFYEEVCKTHGWKADQGFLKRLKEKNGLELKKLDDTIEDAEKNLGEMEVREANLAKAEFLSKIGDKVMLDLGFRSGYLHGAIFTSPLIEEGGDWDRRNRLKVYQGVYCLAVRDFKGAANFFLDTVSTFTSYELMEYKTFVTYTVFVSMIALPRIDLRTKVIKGSEILEVLHNTPDVREYLFSLYNCQYAQFFKKLAYVEQLMRQDRLFAPHYRYYVREMRILAYTQLLESYRSLTLQYMADTFGVTIGFVDKELARYIAAGRLHCKIDKVGGIVETNRPDSKNYQYQATIKQGDILLNRIQKLSRKEKRKCKEARAPSSSGDRPSSPVASFAVRCSSSLRFHVAAMTTHLRHIATEPANLNQKIMTLVEKSPKLKHRSRSQLNVSDSDLSVDTASLSQESQTDRSPHRLSPGVSPSPKFPSSPLVESEVVTGLGKRGGRSARKIEWEILEGLKEGQRCEDHPVKHEGFLLKKRKWPLKGWHKRYFILDKGILKYAKNSNEMSRGKLHGSIDVGLSVISTKLRGCRIDIDADECIYHLKVKPQENFSEWVEQLRRHRLHRQHEISFGTRDKNKTLTPIEEKMALSPILNMCQADLVQSFGQPRTNRSPSCFNAAIQQEKVAAWLAESSGMEQINKDLSNIHQTIFQLNSTLEQLKQMMYSASDPSAELPGLCTPMNMKKERKRFVLRKKKVNKASSTEVTGNNKTAPVTEAVAESIPMLTGPVNIREMAHLSTSNPNLPTSEEKLRPHSLPEATELYVGGFAADLRNKEMKLREDFVCRAKDIYCNLRSTLRSLYGEQTRMRNAFDHGDDTLVNSTSTPTSHLVTNLKSSLAQVVQQNSDLRARLHRIHVESELSETSYTLDQLPKNLHRSVSYESSSVLSTSEYFDAVEYLGGQSDTSTEGSLTDEEDDGSFTSENSEAATEYAAPIQSDSDEMVLQTGRRTRLPSTQPDKGDFNLWNLLCKNIGKDLSKVCMPVTLNEPLNTLQRLCEELEYAELIDRAAEIDDPFEQMVYVAAFAVSGYGSLYYRASQKPFNPLLGETYENIREDKGFRFIAEQVSHHPPVSASYVESKNYVLWQDMRIKTTFWGKSMEIQPIGSVNLILTKTKSKYKWNKVTTCIHNLFSGQRWVDQYGELCITNGVANCKLVFVKSSYWSNKKHEVRGTITNKQGKIIHHLFGHWNEGLYCGVSPSARCIWRPGVMPEDYKLYYGFTQFAIELNELDRHVANFLPPTDTRFRPDQRLLEEGDVNRAEIMKSQLETAQRERKKKREEKETVFNPMWFKKCVNDNQEECWEYNGLYWQMRSTPGFANVPFPLNL